MLNWLFGKKKDEQEQLQDDEAVSIDWRQVCPALGTCQHITLTSTAAQNPKAGDPLKDGAEVSRYAMFGKWPAGTRFQPEVVGGDGIRLHALPRKRDHTGKPDLTNCIGLIFLKNPKAGGIWAMLYDYAYGYGVHKGSPENLHGEPVTQRYKEGERSFYFAKLSSAKDSIFLENMNWQYPAFENITLDL